MHKINKTLYNTHTHWRAKRNPFEPVNLCPPIGIANGTFEKSVHLRSGRILCVAPHSLSCAHANFAREQDVGTQQSTGYGCGRTNFPHTHAHTYTHTPSSPEPSTNCDINCKSVFRNIIVLSAGPSIGFCTILRSLAADRSGSGRGGPKMTVMIVAWKVVTIRPPTTVPRLTDRPKLNRC